MMRIIPLLMAKVLSPVSMMLTVLVLVFVYQAPLPEVGPVWKEVAVGCLSVIGLLASLGYYSFVERLKKVEANQNLHGQAIASLIVAAQTGVAPDFKVEKLFELVGVGNNK